MVNRKLYNVSCVVTTWQSEPGFAIDYAQRALGTGGVGRRYSAKLLGEDLVTLRGADVISALKEWAQETPLLRAATEGREILVKAGLSETGQIEYHVQRILQEPNP